VRRQGIKYGTSKNVILALDNGSSNFASIVLNTTLMTVYLWTHPFIKLVLECVIFTS
jgi:hypothetical protein